MEHPLSTHLSTFLRRVYQTQTAGLAESGAVMRQQVRQSPRPIWLRGRRKAVCRSQWGSCPGGAMEQRLQEEVQRKWKVCLGQGLSASPPASVSEPGRPGAGTVCVTFHLSQGDCSPHSADCPVQPRFLEEGPGDRRRLLFSSHQQSPRPEGGARLTSHPRPVLGWGSSPSSSMRRWKSYR